MASDSSDPAFEAIAAQAAHPVIVSVPHAGRDYPPELVARLRPPVARLASLEDRLVDEVARGLAEVPTLIARQPRAWIDLNRSETEIDPAMIDRGPPPTHLTLSPKVRSGLGLVPRRLSGTGELWRSRFTATELADRIASHHRPYHATLAGWLAAARRRHGVAVLLDLHSMPPLADGSGTRIVIGTRFGRSADPALVAPVVDAVAAAGLDWRENSPYAGGHIVERHGAPRHGIHALQIELDRTLYLDPSLERCDPAGLAATRALLADMVARLARAALGPALPVAAE